MEATPDERRAFGAALADALNAASIDNKDFAHELSKELDDPVSASSISQWAKATHECPRRKVFAMERLLKLKPGALSHHLGYLPTNAKDLRSVPDAIDGDSSLSEAMRRVLRSAYREARGS